MTTGIRHRPHYDWNRNVPAAMLGLFVLTLLAAEGAFASALQGPVTIPREQITLERIESPVLLLGLDSVDIVEPRVVRETGSLSIGIVNRGAVTVTSWSVDVRAAENGASLGRYTSDGYGMLINHEPNPNRAEDLIVTGETERHTVPIDVSSLVDSGEGLIVELVFAIFRDLRFEGSAKWANQRFSERAKDLDIREQWIPRIQELAAGATSNQEALGVLVQLRSELVELPSSKAGRSLLSEVNLKLSEVAESPGRALELLGQMATYLQRDVDVTRRATPAEYRREKVAPRVTGRTDETKAGARRVTAPVMYDCDDVSASRTLNADSCATDGSVWIHDENWKFVCSQPGHDSNGTVNARGHCWHGPYPINCPPEFVEADQDPDGSGNQVWNRNWQNRLILWGPLSTRCGDDGGIQLLSKSCPCEQIESPTEEGANESPPGDGTECTTDCSSESPIIVDLDRGGIQLTNLADGVVFDLVPGGPIEPVAWTKAGSMDAFLVLDRNGNGIVDDGGELFGNLTAQPPSDEPNGFHALRVFDQPAHGGDSDGWLTQADAIFAALRLWSDLNHDGYSDANELVSLSSLGVEEIELSYVESRHRDRHGNEFRYSSRVRLRRSTTLSVDVFLVAG